jgi:hypothetical protein
MDPQPAAAPEEGVPIVTPQPTPVPEVLEAPFWQDPIILAAALGLVLALLVTRVSVVSIRGQHVLIPSSLPLEQKVAKGQDK